MYLTQKQLELWFASCYTLGPVKRKALLAFFGTEAELYNAGKEQWLMVNGITQKDVDAMDFIRKEDWILREYEKLQEKSVEFVSIYDENYPDKLRHISKAPYGLFVRGKLPDKQKISIAIVGARNCTSYGREMAIWFARELSKAGVQVISGLAAGIDGYAHKGALLGNTETYAVLGTGIDICYPSENIHLYEELVRRGGLISEYGFGVQGKPYQFPMRNRIIAGLSDAVLVVEARERSGSLITVDLALEQGKDIYTIPGKIGDLLSVGCNNLYKQGAEMVTSPDDILENYYIKSISEKNKSDCMYNDLDVNEKKVFSCITLEAKHIDDIIRESGLIMSEVISIVVKLELKGMIYQITKNNYVRRL